MPLTRPAISPVFNSMVAEVIEKAETSCVNCRHMLLKTGRPSDREYVCLIQCDKSHYPARRVDKNIGEEWPGVVARRAFRCHDYDYMGES